MGFCSQHFFGIVGGNIPWTITGAWLLLVPFQDSTPCESISKVISLSCRMSSLEGLRILIIT